MPQNSPNAATPKSVKPATTRKRSPRTAETVTQTVRKQVSQYLLDIGVDHDHAPRIMAALRQLTAALQGVPQGAPQPAASE